MITKLPNLPGVRVSAAPFFQHFNIATPTNVSCRPKRCENNDYCIIEEKKLNM